MQEGSAQLTKRGLEPNEFSPNIFVTFFLQATPGSRTVTTTTVENYLQGMMVLDVVDASCDQKFEAGKEAFDGWAARLRDFLDSANELSADDMRRADANYRPYGDAPRSK